MTCADLTRSRDDLSGDRVSLADDRANIFSDRTDLTGDREKLFCARVYETPLVDLIFIIYRAAYLINVKC